MLFQQILPPTTDTSEEIDLREFGRSLLRYWRTLAVIAAITTAIALLRIVTAVPQFQSTGTFYLGGDQQNAVADPATDFLSDYQVVSSVDTQVQLIQSPALVEQAVLETGLNAPITPRGWRPLTFWKWRLFDHKSIEAYAPGPHALVAQFAIFTDPAAEEADFELRVGEHGSYQLFTLDDASGQPALFLTGMLGQPASANGFSVVIKTAPGATPPPPGSALDMTVEPAKSVAQDVLGRLDVAATGPAVSPTNVASVSMVWDNPYQATEFVQQLMQDFIQSQLAWKTESASNTQDYIDQQLQKISAALTKANQNQAAYQSQTGIVDVTSNSQAVIAQLANYQTQRSTLLLQQEALQQLDAAISQRHKHENVNPYLVSQANDPVLSALATTLATAEVKLNTDATQFAGQSAIIRQDSAAIDRLESTIGVIVKNDAAIASTNLANIDGVIAQYQASLKKMPGEALQVGQLSRSTDVLGTLYQLLMQKEEEAEVSKAAAIEDTRIISPAELPDTASAPRPTITLIAGILAGLMLGLVIIVVQRTFADTFRGEADIRRLVPLPAYGIIPQRNPKDLKSGVFSAAVSGPFMEAFRLLRRNLMSLAGTATSQVILVTSPSLGDGRSTIAANIAKALADDGKSVLLFDADLHRGDLSRWLGSADTPGLAEALVNHAQPKLLPAKPQRFKLLPAGSLPDNPADTINSPRLDGLIAGLRDDFDYIILDSSAFPLVSDTAALLGQADLILSVVRAGHTNRQAFLAHCEMFAGADARHGIVINGTPAKPYGRIAGYDKGRRFEFPLRELLAKLKPQGYPVKRPKPAVRKAG